MRTVIVERRRTLERTQLQIAVLVGVKKGTVSKFEAGLLTPKRKLEKWAKAYEFDLESFIAMTDWGAELPLFALMAKFANEDAKELAGFIDTRKEVRSA